MAVLWLPLGFKLADCQNPGQQLGRLSMVAKPERRREGSRRDAACVPKAGDPGVTRLSSTKAAKRARTATVAQRFRLLAQIG